MGQPSDLQTHPAVWKFMWGGLCTQVNEFVKLGGEHLVPYYGDILGAILPAISDKEEKIRVVLSPPLSMPAMSEQCFRIDASRAVVTLTAIMDDCFH
jgi:hypothetical protein